MELSASIGHGSWFLEGSSFGRNDCAYQVQV